MVQYQRLLLISAALLFPFYAVALDQETSSGTTPKLFHHYEYPADSALQKERQFKSFGKTSFQVAQVEERETPVAGKQVHHHSGIGTDINIKSPSEQKEEHLHQASKHEHHMMDMDAGMDMNGHQRMDMGEHQGMDMHEHHMMDMDAGMDMNGHQGVDMGEHQGMDMHEHHMMDMDAGGMVMNENKDNLPRDCPQIAADVEITVRAGVKYAKNFPGTMFGYDQHEWNVKPCSRITVTLINEDNIRHQWMMHMLPTYIYSQGMFHIEVNGPGQRTGTFIVPSVEKTYFVHCDIAQHTEKGMKAQLKVGRGDQDFPSIPGITAPNYPDSYEMETSWSTIGSSLGAGIIGLVLAIGGLGRFFKHKAAAAKKVQPQQTSKPEVKQQKWRWWPF
ncbi:MAG: hypothetical protein ACU4EQ_02575 [Candidatus Nitrosoglobus sp.]|jgi:hypothetical protein